MTERPQTQLYVVPSERAEADRIATLPEVVEARQRARLEQRARELRSSFPERVTWVCLGGFVFVSLCSGWGFREGFGPTLVAAWLLAWVVRRGVRG